MNVSTYSLKGAKNRADLDTQVAAAILAGQQPLGDSFYASSTAEFCQAVGGVEDEAGLGAVNGATVSALNSGAALHHTTLTLDETPVTVANTTGASFGGVKIYDLPQGRILVLGCVADLDFDWAGTDIGATGSGDFSLGTTISADATLSGTDVDLCPSSPMTDPFVAGVGVGTGVLAASAQFDGTTTAKDVNLNIIIDDADVEDAASDIVLVSGTVKLTWINLGDL